MQKLHLQFVHRLTFGSCVGPGGCPALFSGCFAPDLWLHCLAAHTLWNDGRSSDAAGPPVWSGTAMQRKTELFIYLQMFVSLLYHLEM